MASSSSRTYIGVGTNLGDRVQNIIDARSWLKNHSFCETLRGSSLYWSSPVGYLDQPAFINCVFEMEVYCAPDELLAKLQAYEALAGRQRDPLNQNAPRVIDLDILLFNDLTQHSDNLTLPHPRMQQRRFVMEPLLELNSDVVVDGERLAEAYAADLERGHFSDQEVFRLGVG